MLSKLWVAALFCGAVGKRPELWKPAVPGDTCVDASPSSLDFTSQDNVLKVNGDRFYLKGASWFGFETSAYVVHGLWSVTWESLLDFLVTYDFNAMRLPFSCDVVKNNPMPSSINTQVNPDLVGKTSLEIMDIIVNGSAARGIVVMLDMHSLEADGYNGDGLWHDNNWPADQVSDIWQTMIDRYKGYWNVIGMDVFNEPFDATWGDGNEDTDFLMWSEKIGNMALESTGWLINVEGICNGCEDPCFYGENLEGVASHPVELNTPNKVVYSPHVYGPDVYNQPYFNDADFPDNMPAIWTQHWGYIAQSSNPAIVIGEWGGSTSGKDGTWMNALISYLQSIDQVSTYFWCLNPDSGDTGGLLEDDWVTPVTDKLNLLRGLEPNPTKFTLSGAQVCYN